MPRLPAGPLARQLLGARATRWPSAGRLRAAGTPTSVLLARYPLETGAGLGAFKGRAFRIALMGESCTERNVVLCLGALADALSEQGFRPAQTPAFRAQF